MSRFIARWRLFSVDLAASLSADAAPIKAIKAAPNKFVGREIGGSDCSAAPLLNQTGATRRRGRRERPARRAL
jgi:hypothetical protein